MTTINQLSAVDSVVAGDLVPVFVQSNGDARKAAMSVLKAYILQNFATDLSESSEPLADADLFVIYDATQNTSVKISATTVLAYMQANLSFPSIAGLFQNYTKQQAAPSSDGFSVAVTAGSANIWLILTPTAGYATGTIVLPAVANAIDGQDVLINCTQQVTTLTVDGNGATVTGEPASIAADDFFRLRFNETTATWYRVG